jgi:parallel beta-helix repeat protein
MINANNVTLEGDPYMTILQNEPTMKNSTVFIPSTVQNVTLRNLVFNGLPSANQPNAGSTYNFAVQCQAQNVLVEQCQAYYYGGQGFVFEHGAQNCTITDCVSSYAGILSGIGGVGYIVNNCSRIRVVNNTAFNDLGDGINIYQGGHDILVEGNHIEQCTGSGVNCEYWYSPDFTGDPQDRDIVISSNMIISCGYGGNGSFGNTTAHTGGYGGVLLQKCYNILVTGNKIRNCGRGVFVANYRGMSCGEADGSANITITDNEISGNTFEGIHLKNVRYSAISNNMIHGNGRDGIFINSSCLFLTVLHNVIWDVGNGQNNAYSGIHIQHPKGAQCEYLTVTGNAVSNTNDPDVNVMRCGIYDENTPTYEYDTFTDNKREGSYTTAVCGTPFKAKTSKRSGVALA